MKTLTASVTPSFLLRRYQLLSVSTTQRTLVVINQNGTFSSSYLRVSRLF